MEEHGILNDRSLPNNLRIDHFLAIDLNLPQIILMEIDLANELLVLLVLPKVRIRLHDVLDSRDQLVQLTPDRTYLTLVLLIWHHFRVGLVLCPLFHLLNIHSGGSSFPTTSLLPFFSPERVSLGVLLHLNFEDLLVLSQLVHSIERVEAFLDNVEAMSVEDALSLLY